VYKANPVSESFWQISICCHKSGTDQSRCTFDEESGSLCKIHVSEGGLHRKHFIYVGFWLISGSPNFSLEIDSARIYPLGLLILSNFKILGGFE